VYFPNIHEMVGVRWKCTVSHSFSTEKSTVSIKASRFAEEETQFKNKDLNETKQTETHSVE
jgi:hypothetical protein